MKRDTSGIYPIRKRRAQNAGVTFAEKPTVLDTTKEISLQR